MYETHSIRTRLLLVASILAIILQSVNLLRSSLQYKVDTVFLLTLDAVWSYYFIVIQANLNLVTQLFKTN